MTKMKHWQEAEQGYGHDGQEITERMIADYGVAGTPTLVKLHYKSYDMLYGPRGAEAKRFRGHVLDRQTGKHVQRPFDKFFNHSDYDDLPNDHWQFTEKVDGSLCIVSVLNQQKMRIVHANTDIETTTDADMDYVLNEALLITSMRSFDADIVYVFKHYFKQNRDVVKAMLSVFVGDLPPTDSFFHNPDRGHYPFTLMFEYVGPENKSALNKGQEQRMSFLAMRDNERGDLVPFYHCGFEEMFETPKTDDMTLAEVMEELPLFKGDYSEGWVGYHLSGLIVKFKRKEWDLRPKVSYISVLKAMIAREPLAETPEAEIFVITIKGQVLTLELLGKQTVERYNADRREIGKAKGRNEISMREASAAFNFLDNKSMLPMLKYEWT